MLIALTSICLSPSSLFSVSHDVSPHLAEAHLDYGVPQHPLLDLAHTMLSGIRQLRHLGDETTQTHTHTPPRTPNTHIMYIFARRDANRDRVQIHSFSPLNSNQAADRLGSSRLRMLAKLRRARDQLTALHIKSNGSFFVPLMHVYVVYGCSFTVCVLLLKQCPLLVSICCPIGHVHVLVIYSFRMSLLGVFACAGVDVCHVCCVYFFFPLMATYT